MSIQPDQRLISADDHMDIYVLPDDLWQTRLPKTFRERGPRVVETDDGPYWQCEGKTFSPYGRKSKGFLSADDFGFRPSQPAERIKDMDRDGVYSHVIYSPTTTALKIEEPGLKVECLKAYNDWAAEFNEHDRNRLIALPDIPSDDPASAAAELQRCIEMGHRGVIISSVADTIRRGVKPIFDESWHRFWDIAQEARTPIHIHLGGGLHSIEPVLRSWRFAAMVAVAPVQLDEVLAGMIFSGILEKRPEVNFVLGEAGLGWIPYILERMDHELHKFGRSSRITGSRCCQARFSIARFWSPMRTKSSGLSASRGSASTMSCGPPTTPTATAHGPNHARPSPIHLWHRWAKRRSARSPGKTQPAFTTSNSDQSRRGRPSMLPQRC